MTIKSVCAIISVSTLPRLPGTKHVIVNSAHPAPALQHPDARRPDPITGAPRRSPDDSGRTNERQRDSKAGSSEQPTATAHDNRDFWQHHYRLLHPPFCREVICGDFFASSPLLRRFWRSSAAAFSHQGWRKRVVASRLSADMACDSRTTGVKYR